MSDPIPTGMPLREALAAVRRHWADTDRLAASTITVYRRVHRDLVGFIDRGGAEPTLDDVTAETVTVFVATPTRRGAAASPAFRSLRLAVLETTFATGRALGLTRVDPMARMARPARDSKPRPGCTPAQLSSIQAIVREHGLQYQASALIALAAAGASSSEIPLVRIRDVDDMTPATVWLPGNQRRAGRRVALSEFAAETIAARCAYLRAHGADDETPLVRPGEHGQEDVCMLLRELLGRGPGLGHITARSLNALAAADRYAETGDLAAAAELLGTGNYNAVAHLIATIPTKTNAAGDATVANPTAREGLERRAARPEHDRRLRIASYRFPPDDAVDNIASDAA